MLGFVLPGLIDMHVHIPPPARELVNMLFLAHGVTTVREAGDADGTTWGARERIQAGAVIGPRIFASGPVLDGDPSFLPTSWPVSRAEDARRAVAALHRRGADFIKIHHTLSPEALAAIRDEAADRGLHVVGHVPSSVCFGEVGIWDVQHLDGLVPYPAFGEGLLEYQKRWRDLDTSAIDTYVQASLDQGMVHTPTLVTGVAMARMADSDAVPDPNLRLLPRYYRDGIWNREVVPMFNRFTDEVLALMRQAAPRAREIVGRLHEAGVRLHLGTDTAAALGVVPGVSLHEELRLMVASGLSTAQAWIAGTQAAGESLGVPMLGTIRKGAPADLLIFRKDPTHDLDALSSLRAVVTQGRLYPAEYLVQALEAHRKRFERPLYDRLSTAAIQAGSRMMTPGG